ncbi:hypothetical protein Dsin_021227 [Dipteronia sinensis]|uniref:Uncharacterized protein n=1 Tax=Dipteronia sinensis TaxID=43782 RepID=A0AAE0A0A3_9ROSI|nr:hypothetical protein Dsin_021224 [Dipteronia sinensis]KAK3197812.1 hypothetical protein Dsin_021227 [Dipteronia sinensis]
MLKGKKAFPRIYALASQKDGLVCELGRWEGDCWIWDIPLRRSIFDWEIAQWNGFKLALNCISIRFGCPDALAWTFCPNGSFQSNLLGDVWRRLGKWALMQFPGCCGSGLFLIRSKFFCGSCLRFITKELVVSC